MHKIIRKFSERLQQKLDIERLGKIQSTIYIKPTILSKIYTYLLHSILEQVKIYGFEQINLRKLLVNSQKSWIKNLCYEII